MTEEDRARKRVVDAVVSADAKWIRVMDWQGNLFPFILAEEIPSEGKTMLVERRGEEYLK